VIAIQPAQLGVAIPVADDLLRRILMIVGEDPADVRPPERGGVRRMGILFGVGMAVMLAVMSGPPERAFLQSAAARAAAGAPVNRAARQARWSRINGTDFIQKDMPRFRGGGRRRA
jgi:hypothetical protein